MKRFDFDGSVMKEFVLFFQSSPRMVATPTLLSYYFSFQSAEHCQLLRTFEGCVQRHEQVLHSLMRLHMNQLTTILMGGSRIHFKAISGQA